MTTSVPLVAIADVQLRAVARVVGKITLVQVAPREGPIQVVARIDDGSGRVDAIFLGRRLMPGLDLGTTVELQGRVVAGGDVPRIFNPKFEVKCPA